MQPGDMIEWVYKQTNEFIAEDETLWSTLMQRYVPIGSNFVHILISIDNEQLTWLNEEGCFHARMDDTLFEGMAQGLSSVLPRAYG